MRNIRMAVYGLALAAAPSIILQGCAAPMIAAATTSAVGYQTLQTTQASDVNIRFSNDAGALGTPLKSVKTIGVWPSIPEMTALAEKLQGTGAYNRVITPYQINKSLRSIGVNSIDGSMTAYEKQRLYKQVASRTGADGIVYVTPKGESTKAGMMGFGRPEYAMHYQIEVYSPRSNSVIWDEMLDVAISVGTDVPADHVIVGAAVDAVMNRMQVLAGKGNMAASSSYAAAGSGSSMSCSEMRTELSALNRTIQDYYGSQANATMQQFPSAAGTQLATQAATNIAAQTAPGAIAYVQPLMASAKDLFSKFKSSDGEKKIAEAQSRKAYLEAEYARSCTTSAAANAGDPVTKETQALLNQIGYPCGRPDGIAGAKTDEAIRKYQSDRGLLVDGRASPALLAMMKREASISAYE